MTDAPWHESMTVAPIETARAISRTLRELFDAALGQDRSAAPNEAPSTPTNVQLWGVLLTYRLLLAVSISRSTSLMVRCSRVRT